MLHPNAEEAEAGLGSKVSPRFAHDFSRLPVYAGTRGAAIDDSGSRAVQDKSVDGETDDHDGIVHDKDPGAGSGSGSGSAAPAATKHAGIDSFTVKWMRGPQDGPKTAQLRLEYSATFKNDATHDPAAADFAQNAFHKFKVTDGPHKDEADDNSPLHDDNYSRADDPNNPRNGTKFESNDNPGTVLDHLDKDDVIDYSFTAEQMIFDTSDGNKVLQKKGPHTGTIKGKHPRAYDGIPATL